MIAGTPAPLARLTAILFPLLLPAFLLGPCAAPPAAASSRGAGFEIDRWTTEDGLPQSSLRDLIQGPRGYLYISTQDGLARFDGLQFHVFNRGNSAGLESNRLGPLFFASDSTLWIGTLEAGVARYKNGIFHRYGDREGLPHFLVEGIQEAEGGTIFVSTANGSAILRGERFEAVSDSAVGLPPTCHHLAAEDRQLRDSARTARLRNFAAADPSALYVIHGTHVERIPTTLFRLPLPAVVMATDRGGRLWCGTDRDGVFRVEDERLVRVIPPEKLPFSPFDFSSVLQDRSGRIWFSTSHGLYVWDGAAWQQALSQEGVPAPPLGRILEDREGTIWVAGEGGLAALRERAIAVIGEAEGLPAPSVYCVLEDREGRLWIGTQGGGLVSYLDGKVTPFDPLVRTGARIVTALYEDHDGSLWIGTYDHGVYHHAGGRLAEFPALPKDPARRAIAVLRDRRGDLWFGTLDGLYRARAGSIEVIGAEQGLAGNEVRALCQDAKGDLWVGCYGGVTRIAGDSLTNWSTPAGLASTRVRSLLPEPDGTLWIGTYDAGLHRLRNDVITRYKPREGLCPHGVFEILADDTGCLWMGSNQGIYRVRRGDLDSVDAGRTTDIPARVFGVPDGLRSVECNGGRDPSGWKLRDGRLAFATRNGLALVDPRAVPENQVPPPVVIESVLADNYPVALRNPVRVDAGSRNLVFTYAGLSYIRPEQVSFRYRLRGLEEEWTEAGTRRTAQYAHLAPGSYVFEVIAANRDGVWNTKGAQLTIVLLPRVWQTRWFEVLTAAGVASVMVFGYATRRKAARSRDAVRDAFARRIMQSQEAERKTQGLRPAILDQGGLCAAVRELVENTVSSGGVSIETELEAVDPNLDQDVAIQLYRLVEDYMSYVKQSGVKRAAVSLKQTAQGVALTVADNGRGRAGETRVGGRSREVGLALAAMTERVRLLGGECLIEPRRNGGTTIRVRVLRPGA